MRRLPWVLAVVAAGCMGFVATPRPADAQNYPSAPVKMIVAYGPGAGVDVAARVVAEGLSTQMKANVYIENRDGAGGIIGTVAAVKAAPDGYTLLFASEPVTTSQLLQPTMPYDPVKDLKPIAQVITNPLILVASPDAPYKTFKELIAYIKANPGGLSYATSGKGSSSHLETELILQQYGFQLQDVPYKSFGPALTDTITNRVGFFLSAYSALLPSIKSGQVRALVIGSPKRSDELPDVPTMAEEMGIPDYHSDVWYGVLAPAGTPDAIVAVLNEQIAKTMQTPHMIAKVKQLGDSVALSSSAEFAALVRSDTEKWTRVVKSIGLDKLQ